MQTEQIRINWNDVMQNAPFEFTCSRRDKTLFIKLNALVKSTWLQTLHCTQNTNIHYDKHTALLQASDLDIIFTLLL